MAGKLVGINSAIYSRSGGWQGIGFAIPANMVRVVVASAKSGGDAVKLTPTEWRLLELFLRNPGKLLTRQMLLSDVWGPYHRNDAGYLRLYVAQLRRKLEPVPAEPRFFLNEPGLGYRFEPGGTDAPPDV